ncbi:MAG: ComEC/Rec2 family competence protein [Cyanophyceae cyanobacterium]
MNRHSSTVLCLAYIIGLLSTAYLDFSSKWGRWLGPIGMFVGLGIVAGLLGRRIWRAGPLFKIWLLSGLVAALAVLYLEVRSPQPQANDISQVLAKLENNQTVAVAGQVISQPRLTRAQRVQFLVRASRVSVDGEHQEVTGKLYATVPLLQGTGLFLGQSVSLSGTLYAPQPAANPGAFDFRAYLARQGAFAGFQGQVSFADSRQTWELAQWRQRIIQAQVRFLGSPTGPLLSSIVLGRKAVDLPHDIQDLFITAGLAHVLAASGFHVSLLLGVVLGLTRRFSARSQLIAGCGALVIYIGLTGVQASVMRAALMGGAALFALISERKVRQLRTLLLTAALLLLFNPLWIWDLGFQLSFVATLGLMTTLPALQKRLDWLPVPITTLIAVPLAAQVWTLPLSIYVFKTVALYSILINVMATPLVTVVSLGGMVSAIAATVMPTAGSAIAYLLDYPLQLLIAIVQKVTTLPGSSLAVGRMSLAVLVIVYGAICLVWQNQWWQKRWWLVGLFCLSLIVAPISYQRLTQVQTTILAAQQKLIVVVQNRGQVTLIDNGDANTARYTVLPFLAQQGINTIHVAVRLKSNLHKEGALDVFTNLPLNQYLAFQAATSEAEVEALAEEKYHLALGETLLGATPITPVNITPPVLELNIENRIWSVHSQSVELSSMNRAQNSDLQVLVWSGPSFDLQQIEQLSPQVAIAAARSVDENLQQQLQQEQVQLYWTGRDGAIQWTPKTGFKTTLNLTGQDFSLF